MFTGLIQYLGKVVDIQSQSDNLTLIIEEKELSPQLKIDESISHNGICLTVEDIFIESGSYQVTAIKETIEKTNIGQWQIGNIVNLEQAMRLSDRLGGHIVQGHIDCTAQVENIADQSGSFQYTFSFAESFAGLLIDKGSIAINGVSLTCFNTTKNTFSVSIIPYTYDHTTFQYLKTGDTVNLEFDILGKYLLKNMELWKG